MALVIANLLWIIYSVIDGMKDGFYWHFKSNSRRDSNFEIHPIFALQRGLVLLIIGLLLSYSIGLYSIICILSMMLIFSFFHNGTYYYTRNKLDNKIYPLRWKDESTTSTAKLTKIMTYKNRSILMFFGLLLEVFIYIFLMIK
jgi:hypothetical protein